MFQSSDKGVDSLSVPSLSHAPFPGQLSLKVPPYGPSSWAFKGYFWGLGSRLLSDPRSGPSGGAPHHKPIIPQIRSRLARSVPSGPHSRVAASRNEWHPASPHPLPKGQRGPGIAEPSKSVWSAALPFLSPSSTGMPRPISHPGTPNSSPN